LAPSTIVALTFDIGALDLRLCFLDPRLRLNLPAAASQNPAEPAPLPEATKAPPEVAKVRIKLRVLSEG